LRARLARRATRRRAIAAPPVYFMHIMKTGGTAFTTAMAKLCEEVGAGPSVTEIFLDQFVPRDPSEWNNVGFVTGHLPWEVRELLPPQTRSVTVLRDPIDRTLSHFWQVSINPDVRAESPDFSLDEFVDSPRWNTLCRNYQARQLAHRVDLAQAGKTYSAAERFASLGPPFPREHQYPLQSFFDCSPLTMTDAELERVALRALSEIEFVGVTEELDALYALVAEKVWAVNDVAPLGRENTSPDRPRRATISDDLRNRIVAMTTVDQSLYEAAKARSPR
jgi:Sulfotransferase family